MTTPTQPPTLSPTTIAELTAAAWHEALPPLPTTGVTGARYTAADYETAGERLAQLLDHLPDACAAGVAEAIADRVADIIATQGALGFWWFTSLSRRGVPAQGERQVLNATLARLAHRGVGVSWLAALSQDGARDALAILEHAEPWVLAAAVRETPVPLPLALRELLWGQTVVARRSPARREAQLAILLRLLLDYPGESPVDLLQLGFGLYCRPLAEHLLKALPSPETAPELLPVWKHLIRSDLPPEGIRQVWTTLSRACPASDLAPYITALPLGLRAELGLMPTRGPALRP